MCLDIQEGIRESVCASCEAGDGCRDRGGQSGRIRELSAVVYEELEFPIISIFRFYFHHLGEGGFQCSP